jgi:phospholipid/cholesterol/gamma-HCH transport system ATP-binding protein
MSASVPKLRLTGVRKAFGDKQVLDGIDLTVPTGTSLVVIGGSGSGKSVLLKCVLGLIEPDAGSIEIDGQDLMTMSPVERLRARAGIGMLFQNGALFDSLPVWQNVAFGLLAEGKVARGDAKARAAEFLEQVGEIIFFDEPTTGLDPIMGAVIDGLIVDCVKRLGSTAIAITHDMASARRIGDQAAMIHRGRIIWNGPAGQLMDSGNPMVDQFTHGRREGPIQMELRR